MTKGKGSNTKAVGAGGKQKKNKVANDDKREHNFQHHDHGNKHFQDKKHAHKPIACKESKDDKMGDELLKFMKEEKKHRHDPHYLHQLHTHHEHPHSAAAH
eukprot:226998_1